ncbi:MAG: prepilin-type N-terminal cleavage/methylation domain-containing protein [Phycisphaeraceae bacterium]|nr:prepilin-type N-terminal cleavage/methylation domain-containing protein [Phycisphaeraceae bacterium]
MEFGKATRRGFSLVELAISICIVAVLLALSLKSLRFAVLRSTGTVRLSQLATHGRVLAMYCADYKECFPFFLRPEQPSVLSVGGNDVTMKFFDSYWGWNALVGPLYYPGGVADTAFQPPKCRPTLTSLYYWYSATLVSAPEFWQLETRTGPAQWKAQRLSSVQFPSAKAQVVNWGEVLSSGRTAETGFSLIDGSATSSKFIKFEIPIPDGEGNWEGSALQGGYVGIHTVAGVRGRDLIPVGN